MAPAVVRILRRCVANTSQVLVRLASSLQNPKGQPQTYGGGTRTVGAAGQVGGRIAGRHSSSRSSIQHVTRPPTVFLNLEYFFLLG